MSISIKNKVRVSSSSKAPTTMSLFQFSSILRGKKELYSARNLSKKYNKELSSISTKLNNLVRKEIASSFGGTLFSSRSGTGFRPSYTAIVDDRVETGKIKEVETKLVGEKVVVKRGLQLAGRSGIAFSKGRQTFLTGLKAVGEQIQEETTEVATTRLFNRLVQAKDSEEIKRILSTKGEANTALRKNIELNTQTINLIATINGKVENRRIGFSWPEIKKNKDIKISVKKQSDETISLQVYFTSSILNKAINDSNRVLVSSLEKEVSAALVKAASEMLIQVSDKNILEFRKFLFSQSSKYALGYLSDTNQISKGQFTRKRKRKVGKDVQRVISDAQFSALVRQRTSQKMAGPGPVGGPPLSDTVLTYRTGRFAESILAKQDFKKQLVYYYYMPLYRVHEATRPPSKIIGESIREISQALYKRQFEPRANFNL